MAYIAASQSLPLGIEVHDELFIVFHDLICFVDQVLNFLLGPLWIPALLSCQSAQVPLIFVNNELPILSSIYGAFSHQS